MQYTDYIKNQIDMQERQQQKLNPPIYGENLYRFTSKHKGYIINDSSTHADQNTGIRSIILAGIVICVIAFAWYHSDFIKAVCGL